jgi:photoactive yellow protein
MLRCRRRSDPADKAALRSRQQEETIGEGDFMAGPVDFDSPDLAHQIENLSQAELNALPFGVMLLDLDGLIRFYSDTEARLSGYNQSAVGINLYEFCEKFGGADFRGRIADAAAEGPVNLEFGWTGDYHNPKRDMRVRVQSASRGGVWVCIDRD